MTPYHQGQLDFFCAVYAYINGVRLLYGAQLTQAREILATALSEISARPALWHALITNNTDHHWVLPYMLGRFSASGPLALKLGLLPEKPPADLQNASPAALNSWLRLGRPAPLNLDELDEAAMWRPGVEFGPHLAGPGQSPAPGKRPWQNEAVWQIIRAWLPSRKLLGVFGPPSKQKRCLLLRFHRFLPYQPGPPLISHWTTGQDFSKDTLNLFDCTANKEATHSLNPTQTALYPEHLDGKRLFALEPQSLYFLEKV